MTEKISRYKNFCEVKIWKNSCCDYFWNHAEIYVPQTFFWRRKIIFFKTKPKTNWWFYCSSRYFFLFHLKYYCRIDSFLATKKFANLGVFFCIFLPICEFIRLFWSKILRHTRHGNFWNFSTSKGALRV